MLLVIRTIGRQSAPAQLRRQEGKFAGLSLPIPDLTMSWNGADCLSPALAYAGMVNSVDVPAVE